MLFASASYMKIDSLIYWVSETCAQQSWGINDRMVNYLILIKWSMAYNSKGLLNTTGMHAVYCNLF
jgi:hypothetical protein